MVFRFYGLGLNGHDFWASGAEERFRSFGLFLWHFCPVAVSTLRALCVVFGKTLTERAS